jgi:integrase
MRSPHNSKAGAEAYEALLRQKLARGEVIGKTSLKADQEQTFGEFAAKVFDDYVVPNNKRSEQRTKKYILGAALIPFFGRIPVSQITVRHIDQYKAHEVRHGVTNKTLKNRLTVLNKCLLTAYEWLELSGAPPKIKWPKCASYRTDYLSADECDLLLNNANGVTKEMIFTALRTGMRQGELRGLQWSSIDWENRIVSVRHSRCDYTKGLVPPKNNKERHIPLDTDLFQMLHERKRATGYVFLDIDGEPFDNKRLTRRLARARKRAGLRQFGWHTLRHTFGSHLAAKGAPISAIQELMGHANITTTMRYIHLAPSTLRAVIDMLNPKSLLQEDFGQPVVKSWQQMQQREMHQKDLVPKYL